MADVEEIKLLAFEILT